MNVRISYKQEPDGTWFARVPALRVNAGGPTKEEARRMAIQAIQFTIECLEDEALESESSVNIETVSV